MTTTPKTKTITRKAIPSDVRQIVDIHKEAFGDFEYKNHPPGLSTEYFRDIVRSAFNGLYVAEVNNKVVGYVLFIPIVLNDTVELMQMAVKDEYRGKGVGTALLNESGRQYVEKLKQKGINVYAKYLTTSSDNPSGYPIYKRAGFEESGRIKNTFIGLGNEEIVMTEILDRTRIYKPGTLWIREEKPASEGV